MEAGRHCRTCRLRPHPSVFWFLLHVEKEPAPQGGTLQKGAPRSSRPTERGDGGEIPPKNKNLFPPKNSAPVNRVRSEGSEDHGSSKNQSDYQV